MDEVNEALFGGAVEHFSAVDKVDARVTGFDPAVHVGRVYHGALFPRQNDLLTDAVDGSFLRVLQA